MTAIFIGIFVVVALFLFAVSGDSPRQKMAKRIGKIQQRKIAVPRTSQDVLTLRRKQGEQVSPFLTMLMKPLPNVKSLSAQLERAGSQSTARRFLLRSLLAFALIVSVISGLMGKRLMLGISVGIIFAFWLPLKILKFKIAKQLKRFLRLFPDGIDLIVRGLRSGLPVSESITLVAKEVEDPVGHTFEMIASTMKLGVPLEKALQEMAIKLDCTEFNFFTTSIVLQRETGGNLAEILSNLSEVLRKRFMMRMKIKAMSSEARASAIIIGSLPFIVFIALLVISPGYTDPLFKDYRGNVCLGVAIGMLCTGVWSMNRMAKFEI